MKLLFIPNWNGHLHINEYDDESVSVLYNEVEFENKELVKVVKNNIEETNSNIETSFSKYKDEFRLSITGDHSNSYPLIKAYSNERKDTDFKLVIFDAHPDVEVSTDSVSHEDYLRNLIDDGFVKGENVYLFGIRTFSRKEFEYLEEKGINYYSITDVLRDKENINKVLSEIEGDIYLSIDIDALDPDHAPGTYYAEWCGLYIDELIEFTNIIKPKIKSADITEYYAKKDDEEQTTKTNTIKLIDTFIN